MRKGLFGNNKGQSLIEVLIGIAVGVIIIGGVAATIALTFRSNVQTKNSQTATSLSQEIINEVTDFTAGNWHNLDTLTAGTQYRLATTGPAFTAVTGVENFVIDSKPFTRYFTYSNVSRDPNTDAIQSVYDLNNDDPSTKKITVTVSWQEGASNPSVSISKFVTRSKNLVFVQTDWSGAAGQVGPITAPNNRYDSKSNIDSTGVPGSIKVQGF